MSTATATALAAAPPPSSFLPIAAAFDADAASLTGVILRYLPLAHQLRDYDRVNYYLRRLLSLLDQRLELSDSDRTTLVRHVLSVLETAQELHIQIRCMQVANQLLKKRGGGGGGLPELSIDWRPLMSLLSSLHFPSARAFTYPQSLLHQHSSMLLKLIRHARRYFTAAAGQEVWAEFSPFLSPFDNASTRAFSLISLFTPTHREPDHTAALLLTLPQLLQYGSWYDHSPTALLPFFSLYARIAKHQLSISLLPQLPQLYSCYLQLLELDVGGQQSSNHVRTVQAYSWLNEGGGGGGGAGGGGSAMETISKHLAKITVFLLHHPESAAGSAPQPRSALSVLAQFLHTVETYFHPSNQGRWSNSLAALLSELGAQYAKRRGKEQHGRASYGSQHFLSAADNSFVSVLLPTALQALFSKSHTMVGAAEAWLKHTAFFHPSLVLPALVSHVYPALDDLSSPHRLLSVMQALSQLAPILFHRVYYPQGAHHLDALLWATLPGVDAMDAMKTSLTLTFYTIVFYSVPFIDARKTDGLTKARSDTSRDDEPRPRVVERITSSFKQLSDSGGVEHEEEEEEQPQPLDGDEDDLSEEDARAATFRFEDWSLAFLDSIFTLLASADRYAKADFLDVHSARLLGKVLRAFFACQSDDIFLSCALKIVKAVLGKQEANATKQWGIIVAAASLRSPQVMLSKLFDPLHARLVSAAQGAGGRRLSAMAKSELDWSLYLMSQVVKQAGGSGDSSSSSPRLLLSYREKVVTAYRLTRQHEERSVRKVGGKLIRNYLAALSSVYPAEWRPFDSRQWSATERWRHWNCWCAFTPEEERDDDAVIDPRIAWHVPSEQEMQAVDEIVNAELQEPLTVLSRFIDGKEEEKAAGGGDEKEEKGGRGDGPIERALLSVANIVRGAQAVLGDIDGSRTRAGEEEGQDEQEEANAETAEAAFTGARCPLVNIKRSRPLRPVKNQLPMLSSSSSLRSALLPFLHRLSTRLLSSLSGGQSSLKALALLIRLLSLTLLSYGVNESKLNTEQYIAGFTRQWLREWRSGFRISLRPLLVQRSYHFFLTRTADASKGQTYSDDVRIVLHDLQQLATNDFAKVRQKAHKALVAAIFHFPQSIDGTLSAITAALSSPASSSEQVSGCLSVLADPTVIALSARRWSRLVQVVEALSAGISGKERREDDDKNEVLLQTYFAALFPSLYPLPVYIAPVPEAAAVQVAIAAEKVRRRNESISRYNSANERRYQQLVSSLLLHAQSAQLHWRYQLMSAAFLFVLVKPSALTSSLYDDVVAFFLSMLRSELAPMRHIANEALANIFGMHHIAVQQQRQQQAGNDAPPPTDSTRAIAAASPSASVTKDGAALAVTSIDTEEQLLSTVFHDYLYSGWQDEPGTVVSYYRRLPDSDEYAVYRSPSPFHTGIPPSLHPSCTAVSASALSAVSSSLSSHLTAIVSFLVQHHPTLDAKVEGSSSSNAQTGAGDQISALACSHFSPVLWPFTRIQVQSKAFDFTHVALVRGLVEAVGAAVEAGGVWERELRRLVEEKEQQSQCTAAELVAGIVKGSKHLPMRRQQSMQSWLLPCLLSALASSQPDAVSHWTAALRYVYSNMDPRRLAWLTRPLLLSAFNALPPSAPTAAVDVTSPLLQYKRFHFLTPVLVEQGYRAAAVSQWLLQRLSRDGWLASEYKQVRSEVAWIAFLSLENQFKVRKDEAGVMELLRSDELAAYVSHLVRRLQGMEGLLYRSTGAEEKKAEADADAMEEEEEEGHLGNGKAVLVRLEDAMPPEAKKEETPHQAKLFLETVLTSLLLSLLTGSAVALSPQYQALLPFVIRSQHVTDIECAALGRQVAKVAAWVALKGVVTTVQADGEVRMERRFDTAAVIASVLTSVNELLLSSAAASSWHVKVSALRYLQVLVPRHSLLMTAQHVTDVEATILQVLVHAQVEVREQAAAALSSLLSSCLSHPSSSVIGFSSSLHASSHVLRLIKHCTALSRTAYRDKSSKKVEPALLARRHGGVLGLLSLVACHPYDLPRHLPALLQQLASHVNDPQPISGAVRKGVAEFMRTHKEEWEQSFRDRFTEEQLDALSSVQGAATYVA